MAAESVYVTSYERILQRGWLAFVAFSLLIVATTATMLIVQPPVFRGPVGQTGASIVSIHDGIAQDRSFGFDLSRIYRSIFVVEEFTITEWDNDTKQWVYGMVPANSDVYFVGHISYEIKGAVRDVVASYPVDRYRFIGYVSIRPEILWSIVALGSLGFLFFVRQAFRSRRRLRRVKRGLCPVCAYPLLIRAGEDVQCSECGTEIILDRCSACGVRAGIVE